MQQQGIKCFVLFVWLRILHPARSVFNQKSTSDFQVIKQPKNSWLIVESWIAIKLILSSTFDMLTAFQFRLLFLYLEKYRDQVQGIYPIMLCSTLTKGIWEKFSILSSFLVAVLVTTKQILACVVLWRVFHGRNNLSHDNGITIQIYQLFLAIWYRKYMYFLCKGYVCILAVTRLE